MAELIRKSIVLVEGNDGYVFKQEVGAGFDGDNQELGRLACFSSKIPWLDSFEGAAKRSVEADTQLEVAKSDLELIGQVKVSGRYARRLLAINGRVFKLHVGAEPVRPRSGRIELEVVGHEDLDMRMHELEPVTYAIFNNLITL